MTEHPIGHMYIEEGEKLCAKTAKTVPDTMYINNKKKMSRNDFKILQDIF